MEEGGGCWRILGRVMVGGWWWRVCVEVRHCLDGKLGQEMHVFETEIGEVGSRLLFKYLKEQRLPPQTFIPLQSVRVKQAMERLHNLGGTAKLVFDVVQYPFFMLLIQNS
ncbi:structural maintenance of chromosomes protein 1A-like [Rosa chinensis]|uniref:structural maintenance of chromosomes protein 1A-like n=1 Tax=Rosa chinensis TaxID=74649 RepID=UPI001AD91ECA|nr:structural maintenance of chromosomes protein 1A-like [Rosa chinensis]